MRLPLTNYTPLPIKHRTDAGVRIGLVALVSGAFLAGAAAGSFWLYRTRIAPVDGQRAEALPSLPALSDSTLAVLKRLDAPLALRFYAVLDPASTSPATQAYAQRVDQWLAAYAQAANGKLKLIRYASLGTDVAEAAAADGVTAFNIDKGNACYLGVGLELKGKKESLAQLSPEWQAALEPDLTRAIARLVEVTHPAPGSPAISQVNTAAVEQVKTLIPNLATVSVADGTRLLRAAALKDFQVAAKEMQERIQTAQQKVLEAQQSQSAAELQAALKDLQQVQAEQSQRLKEIAAQAQAQVQAFQSLKAKP